MYDYPVKNYFGPGAMRQALETEMPAMGTRVMLAYGSGSVKRSGLYDEVVALLEGAGKEVVDFGGIMSNPTYDKVQEGAALDPTHTLTVPTQQFMSAAATWPRSSRA